MDLTQRIKAFANLGKFLTHFNSVEVPATPDLKIDPVFYTDFKQVLNAAKSHNAWFTREQIDFALQNWAGALTTDSLQQWTANYTFPESPEPKRVAVIMAGNLPLVGLHDFLSVLITGNHIVAKLSSDDKFILPFLARILIHFELGFKDRITFTEERLPAFDAVIATGSNNTARYFEFYFKDKPHIIRKNRNAVAVLDGKESKEQLEKLGDDIFRFFGMGCRSVAKLFVPKGYDFDDFYKAMYAYKEYINHNKYANNYDYNKAVYLMSLFPVLDNGFLVLKEDAGFSSPIAVLFYEYYDDADKLRNYLEAESEKIQCIVSSGFTEGEISFGNAQIPKLMDYADGVDTIAFLLKI